MPEPISTPTTCDDTIDTAGACAAVAHVNDMSYTPSCGLANPALVTDELYATGSGYSAYVIEGVDPEVLLAWPSDTCGEPMNGHWHLMFANAKRGSPEENEAMCRAALNPPDPAEGFRC